MRKLVSCALLLAILTTLSVSAFAAVSGAEVKTYQGPFLITNAGQGPGGKMARLLTTRTKTVELDKDFFYNAEPQEKDLDEKAYSCLVVVVGSTDKGLGASGITIDDEIERLNRMVKHAEEIKLPIIAVLLEKDKRSEIPTNANERCIDAIFPHAEWMIVVAEGNTDGRFTKLSEENNIPLTILDVAKDYTKLAAEAFTPAP